jgi:hypothetical protein
VKAVSLDKAPGAAHAFVRRKGDCEARRLKSISKVDDPAATCHASKHAKDGIKIVREASKQ